MSFLVRVGFLHPGGDIPWVDEPWLVPRPTFREHPEPAGRAIAPGAALRRRETGGGSDGTEL